MSFIHASFWNKKLKANGFDELCDQMKEFQPQKVTISIKDHHWKKNQRNSLDFNLSGAFSDIEKDLKILQRKFGRL